MKERCEKGGFCITVPFDCTLQHLLITPSTSDKSNHPLSLKLHGGANDEVPRHAQVCCRRRSAALPKWRLAARRQALQVQVRDMPQAHWLLLEAADH